MTTATEPAFYQGYQSSVLGAGDQAVLSATVVSDAACGGPWSPQLQHGGPPSALLILVAEQLAAVAAGRSDLIAARLAAEFIGPVPVAELTLSARVCRRSRSAVLVSAKLGTADRVCLQARIWLLGPGEPAPRATEQAEQAAGLAAARAPAPTALVEPEQLAPFPIVDFPYATKLDWRLVSGAADQPGPAAAWVRPRIALVAGQRLSSLQRAALIGDSASGISAELDWQGWSFANVDLDLHLFRPSAGPWLLLEAETRLGGGLATTRSTLSDRTGPTGFGLQTLLVRPSRN